MGTRMSLPYANLFIGKEERTVILTFLQLIYCWKRFIDDIFHSQPKFLMTLMNTISRTIKYTFTSSEQTASFFTFLNLENSRQNSIQNQATAWHNFDSALTIHSVVKKV